MKGDTVNGSWLSILWPVSRKSASDDKAVIGILASEVCSLMLKVANLWHFLSDNEVISLREEIVNSLGVKKLVSNDENFLMELVLNEILCNLQCLARSVARLSKRCEDPTYHRFEQFVDNPVQNCFEWSRWAYRWNKMERKVKKMERFAAAMTKLSPSLEVLAERERTLRRMKANRELNRVKLLEFQKKVMLQCQEVTTLTDMTPWNRSYDYIVRLLARSLSTILERFIVVFGNHHQPPIEYEQNDFEYVHADHRPRSHSFSTFRHSSVHQSHNDPHGFNSKHLKKHQQPLRSVSMRLGHVEPFIGCMSVGTDSPEVRSWKTTTIGGFMKNVDKTKTADRSFVFNRMRIYSKLCMSGELRPPPFTLGDAALALHYANVIILIEKMASSPHLIDLETRDDLYDMLPTTIRTALRARLRGSKNKASSTYDANIAAGWGMVVKQILEWLAPLAHNTRRWHSERSYEKEHTASKANVLLVQTLYFANQAKAEAAIVELLVGLNYECRIHEEPSMVDSPEFVGTRYFNGVRLRKNDMCYEFL